MGKLYSEKWKVLGKKSLHSRSRLHSAPDIQSIVKKAMVERLKGRYHVSWFEESGR